MSMMPDCRQEALIELPGNAQFPLRNALVTLHRKRPDLFKAKPHTISSMWDVGFLLNAEGGEFLADLIQQAMTAEEER